MAQVIFSYLKGIKCSMKEVLLSGPRIPLMGHTVCNIFQMDCFMLCPALWELKEMFMMRTRNFQKKLNQSFLKIWNTNCE